MQISSMEKRNNSWSYSTLKGGERHFYFISSWLCSVISFQWVQYEDDKNVELHSNFKNTASGKWARSVSSAMSHG